MDIKINVKEIEDVISEINERGLTRFVNYMFQKWQKQIRDARNDLADPAKFGAKFGLCPMPKDLPSLPRFTKLTKEEAESRYMVLSPEEIEAFLKSQNK